MSGLKDPARPVEWTVAICICLLIGSCTVKTIVQSFKEPARVGTTEIVK